MSHDFVTDLFFSSSPLCLLLFLSDEWWGCNARRPSSFWGHPGQRVLAGLPIPQTGSHPGHWPQGFLSPLSHTCKWNFLKILIQLGGRSHLLAPCPWQQHCRGLGKWHEASHPPTFLVGRVRAGKGNSSMLALAGCLPCDFTLFTPTIFLRNLGKGDDLPMAARAGEIWACSWSSGRSQALWKMKAIRIFLPHLRNESTYLHVSCGQFKAGTGKEIGGLKPTSVSQMNTTNPWACFTLRNKGGTVGLGKSWWSLCSTCQPQRAASRRVTETEVSSIQHCHQRARAGRSAGTEQGLSGKQKYWSTVLEMLSFFHNGTPGWYFC